MRLYTSLFVYGTLAVPELRKALIGDCEVLDPVYLAGHQLCYRQDGFAFCLAEPNSWVSGCLIEVTTAQWEIIEAWEDCPNDYTLSEVLVYYWNRPINTSMYNGKFQSIGPVLEGRWYPYNLSTTLEQIRDFLFLFRKNKKRPI